MKQYQPIIILIGAVLLGGCTEGLAGFGGSMLSAVGGGISESYEEKKAAIAEYKIINRRLLVKEMVLKETHADVLIAKPDTFKKGMEELRQLIEDHEKNQPIWLYEKIIKRYKDK